MLRGLDAAPWREVVLAALAGLAAACLALLLLLGGKTPVLVLLGGAALVGLFMAARDQRLFLLWGLVLTAPLSLSKSFVVIAHMGGAGAYAIDAMDVFLAPLLAFILADRFKGRGPKLRWTPVTFWWGALILLGVADIISGPHRQLPAQETVRMVKCWLLFLVVVNECRDRRRILSVVAALAVGVLAQACAGVIQGVFHANLHLQMLGEATAESIRYANFATYAGAGDEPFRVNGVLGHPNLLAAFLSMLLPMLYALLFARIPKRWKLAVAAIAGLGVLALVMTFSRTSWITFAIAFGLVFLVATVHPRLRRRFIFTRVATLGAVCGVALAFAGPILKRVFESDPGAVRFRYEWNHVAWDMGVTSHYLGVGLNTFIFHLPGYTRMGGIEGLNEKFGPTWPAAHSIFALTFAEQGAPGIFFLLGLYLYLLLIGLRNIARFADDAMFAVNLGCLAGAVSIMIDGLSSFFMRNPAPARSFWVFAGLMVAVHYWTRAHTRPAPAPAARHVVRSTALPAAS